MAGDSVTTQDIVNGSRIIVRKLTNISDGTGESAVVKVDASVEGCRTFRIKKIEYDIQDMSVTLLWGATANVQIGTYKGFGKVDAYEYGGINNNAAATGKTGDILLTTNGASAGSSYTITLELVKVD